MLRLKPLIYPSSSRVVVTEASTVPIRLAGSPIVNNNSVSFPVNEKLPLPSLNRRSFSVSMESTGVDTTSPSVVKLKPIDATPESFKEFGQVIEASPDGDEFGPRDAQLDLSRGIPRFYIMQLKDRSLKFSSITHHANVTQCLGSIGGNVWYLGVAKASIVDPADIKGGMGAETVQSHCGHFYVPPAVDEVQAFRISGTKFIKLNHGTWHAGPLFTDDKMDFYNLELHDTNHLTDEITLLERVVLNMSRHFCSYRKKHVIKVVDHTTHNFSKKNGVVFLLED